MALNTLLQRKRQILSALEVTCGTFVTPSASGITQGGGLSDTKHPRILSAPSNSEEVPMFERELANASLSNFDGVPGEQSATASFTVEAVGSGDVLAPPEVDPYLRACAMARIKLETLPIGAITGGSFNRNDIITGTTSAATGRIIVPALTGEAVIYIEVLTGTFDVGGEVLTVTSTVSGAAASGNTASSSAGISDAGFSYKPRSSGFETISLSQEEDGYVKQLAGCAGTFSLNFDSSKPGAFEFEMLGKIQNYGDQALSTLDFFDTIPPILQDAKLELDNETTGFSPVVASATFEMANESPMRIDANDTSGFISANVTKRKPIGSITPEMVLAASYDFFDKWFNGTNISLKYKAGAAAANTLWFFGDKGQFTGQGDSERDGISTLESGIAWNRLTDTGDDEVEIVFI